MKRRLTIFVTLCLVYMMLPAAALGEEVGSEASVAPQAIPAQESSGGEPQVVQESWEDGSQAVPDSAEIADGSQLQEEATSDLGFVDEDVAAPEVSDQQAASSEAADDALVAEASDDAALQHEAIYAIAASHAPSMRVSAAQSAAAAGTNVSLANDTYALGEYWQAIAHADGSYSLASITDGLALGYGGTAKAGSNVCLVSGEGSRWRLISNLDGTFTVVPVADERLCLDVSGAAKKAGTNVVLWTRNGNANQSFLFLLQEVLTDAFLEGERLDGGYVSLEANDGSGRMLDIAGASSAKAANAMVYASNSALNQKYALVSVGKGLYEIKATHSGQLIEIYKGGTTVGANVEQYTSNGLLHQLWYFVREGNGYSIRSAKSGLALCTKGSNVELGKAGQNGASFLVKRVTLLDDGGVYRMATSYNSKLLVSSAGNSSGATANVQLESTANVLGVYWVAEVDDDGTLLLRNMRSGSYLTVDGTLASRTNVALATSSPTRWIAECCYDGGICLHPQAKPTLSLDIPGAANAAGTNVWLWTSNGGKAQKLSFVLDRTLTEAVSAGQSIEEGVYALALASAGNLALDISGASKANCAQLLVWNAGSKTNQKFQFEYAGSGLYVIRSAVSGKVIELYGGTSKAGTLVKQYTGNDRLHQYWYITKNGDGYAIRSAFGGLGMSLFGGKAAAGTNIVLGTACCAFAINEVPLVDEGTYVICTELALPLVLDVQGDAAEGEANVQLGRSSGAESQQFEFTYLGKGFYRIASKDSGLVLEVAGGTANGIANVQFGAATDEDCQVWRLGVSSTGTVTFQNAESGQFMDVQGGTKRTGTNIIEYQRRGHTGQSFILKEGAWCFGDEVVRVAMTQLGAKYTEEGSAYYPGVAFNCSGLSWWVYHTVGYNISHNQGYYSYYTGCANMTDSQMWQIEQTGGWKTNVDDLVVGDLVFFSPKKSKWHTGHVGIYIGNGLMIDANVDGVKIRSVSRSTFVGGGLPIA